MSGSRSTPARPTAEPWLTVSRSVREQLRAAMDSLSASDFGLRTTQLFGITCVLIEGAGPGIGLISSSPMLPKAGPGSRRSEATGR